MEPLCPPPVRGGVDLASLMQPDHGRKRAFYVDPGRDLLVLRPYEPDSWSHWFWGLLDGCWFSRQELIDKGRLPVTDAGEVQDRLYLSVRPNLIQHRLDYRGPDPSQLVVHAQALVEYDCGDAFRNYAAEERFKLEATLVARRAGLTRYDVKTIAGFGKNVPQGGRTIGQLEPWEIFDAVVVATKEQLHVLNDPVVKQAVAKVPYHGDPEKELDLRARVTKCILKLPECSTHLLTEKQAEAAARKLIACEHHMAMLQDKLSVDWNTAEFVYERAVTTKRQEMVILTTEPTDAEYESLVELLKEPGIDCFGVVDAKWLASANSDSRRQMFEQSKEALRPWLAQREKAVAQGTAGQQVKKLQALYSKELPEYTGRLYLALVRIEGDTRLANRQKAALSQQLTALQLPPEHLDAYAEAVLKVQALMHACLAVVKQRAEGRAYPDALLADATLLCGNAISTMEWPTAEHERAEHLAETALLGLPDLKAKSLKHFPALFASEVVKPGQVS